MRHEKLKGGQKMQKYIVALANLPEGTNEIHFVEAPTPIEAIKMVLGLSNEITFETVEEIQQYAFDLDLLISEPFLIH
jgi:hypothetical protein